MIIVSQDKKRIVNFDNLTQVYITHCEEDNTGYFIRFETVDSLYEDLGEYATEERAKEVLQEISSTFAIKGVRDANYQYADIWIKMRQHAIYEMPKE